MYETILKDLKSIAKSLGLQYSSCGGFIRRNFPETIEKYTALFWAKQTNKHLEYE
ncbi:hypothetical protein M124_1523 [Bacteroides fragilis str. 3988T(B)14]|uniref:Uncharacterized protein n=1 Tax=Bacteroides fragilis str. 3988T(B)14 TaxID=1339315 RepID=A0A015SR67_BACFG|nr:hypothetical protein M085_1547 [Bacteroides fragilis str. 3986 N(B)19]EXY74694.1 hypothetical protein M124_1523 [Bacteroides fragilis str. 3988T(B)14]EXY80611.1 hypothetical protein M084_1605 [Bacteroides fragilis str. 3988 T1]EYA48648.1 hypothetical protein M115_1674 [Bacteroides fragilis str. 3719 T6]